ncbi:hypothetical protein [Burkholderia glumae]|uniref:hypothetical protein n=1 Tax=Burkholderia glumae TaxID=337 RepID=UPI003F5652A5
MLTHEPGAHRGQDAPCGVAAARRERPRERPPGKVEPLHPAPPDPALGRLRVGEELLQVLGHVERVERRERLALGDDGPQQQPLGLAPVGPLRLRAARAADRDPGVDRLQVGVHLGLVRGHGRAVQARRAVERSRHAQCLERHHFCARARERPQGRVAGRELPARHEREPRQRAERAGVLVEEVGDAPRAAGPSRGTAVYQRWRRRRISASRASKVVMPTAARRATTAASNQPLERVVGARGFDDRRFHAGERRVLPFAQTPIARDLPVDRGRARRRKLLEIGAEQFPLAGEAIWVNLVAEGASSVAGTGAAAACDGHLVEG